MAQYMVHIYMYIQSRQNCCTVLTDTSNTVQHGKLAFCPTHKYVIHTIRNL